VATGKSSQLLFIANAKLENAKVIIKIRTRVN
jgi:hypothetical protein